MAAPLPTGLLVITPMQLRFCIDAPSCVRAHELLQSQFICDVGTAGRNTPHPDVGYQLMGDSAIKFDVA